MTGWLRRGAIGLAFALALSACGSGDDDPLAQLGQGDSSVPQAEAAGPEASAEVTTTLGDSDEGATDGAEETGDGTAAPVDEGPPYVPPSGDTLVASVEDGVSSVVAYQGATGGAEVETFANPVQTGGPLVFQVVGESGGDRVEVLLPMRPNGTTGWVDADDVTLFTTPYRIAVDVSRHELTVFDEGKATIVTEVGIGTGDTPTPIGEFYLYELLKPPNPNGPYGTYAFGLSGFSETLEQFNGGNGVIGIHGTNDPGTLGTDVSHGCIRVENGVISDMAGFLPLGTPVVINP